MPVKHQIDGPIFRPRLLQLRFYIIQIIGFVFIGGSEGNKSGKDKQGVDEFHLVNLFVKKCLYRSLYPHQNGLKRNKHFVFAH